MIIDHLEEGYIGFQGVWNIIENGFGEPSNVSTLP